MRDTILWHDYETTGRDPRSDRPLQFGAMRTSLDLEPVGEPVAWRTRLPEDVLPDPEACLVTRTVPGDHADEEIGELEFARSILAELAVPGTCVAGYNSVRFDDEFTRFLLWRNLLPVYDREWRHGNSRFDLLDALRAAYAFRPEGLEWPVREDGAPSFRLEHLTAANGIEHGAAHDALADVVATVEMARRMRAVQPKLYDYVFDGRVKQVARDRLGIARGFEHSRPVAHVSGRFPSAQACVSVVLPICQRPGINTQALCVDLRHGPAPLLDGDPEQLRSLLFTRRAERPAGAPEIGLKTVHLNRGPVLAPLAALDAGGWERSGLERSIVERHATQVQAGRDRVADVLAFLVEHESAEDPDPDQGLYDGFVGDSDARTCRQLHERPPQEWRRFEARLADERLRELLFRLRARNAAETLDEAEQVRWREHVAGRLCAPRGGGASRLREVAAALEELRERHADDVEAQAILDRYEAFLTRRTEELRDGLA